MDPLFCKVPNLLGPAAALISRSPQKGFEVALHGSDLGDGLGPGFLEAYETKEWAAGLAGHASGQGQGDTEATKQKAGEAKDRAAGDTVKGAVVGAAGDTVKGAVVGAASDTVKGAVVGAAGDTVKLQVQRAFDFRPRHRTQK